MRWSTVGVALALAIAGVVGRAGAASVTLTTTYTWGYDNVVSKGFVGIRDGSLVVNANVPDTDSPTIRNDSETIVGAFGWHVTGTGGAVPTNYSVGSDIFTYCIQLEQFFYVPSTNDQYTLNYGITGSPLGGHDAGYVDQKAALQLQKLVTNDWDLALTSASNGAAFQLAVWEIVYDGGAADVTTPSPDNMGVTSYFTTGHVRASASSVAGVSAINTATSWLNQLNTLPNSVTSAVALNSPSLDFPDGTLQDQLGRVVPLPPGLPVGLSMLAGLALIRKLRRRSQRTS